MEVSDLSVPADQQSGRKRLDSSVEFVHFFIRQDDRIVDLVLGNVGVDRPSTRPRPLTRRAR